MSEKYYPGEARSLLFQVEMATGEYFSKKHGASVRQEDLPMERSRFTWTAKQDPLLLWKVAEWWHEERSPEALRRKQEAERQTTNAS